MDLIKFTDNKDFPVDSRDLYEFLEPKQRYNDWWSSREKYFLENEDFYYLASKSEGGRPQSYCYLTMDATKHLAMLERTEKGKQIRQWFIEKEKELKGLTLNQRELSPLDLMKQMIQVFDQQQKQLNEQAIQIEKQGQEIEKVKELASYESIHQMVQDSLEEETINVFPDKCSKLETIRELIFIGISEAVISKYLHHIGHPTKEYTFKLADNVLRSVTVFDNNGLTEAFLRFKNESIFQKTTPKNDQYYHPVLGNYRIKKLA